MLFKKKKYDTYSDEQLMQFIQKGKEAAFDELYNRYRSRMYFYFYKMLWQDEEKANDFTQELFMKIIEKPQLFNTQKRFSTWFYTLANNLCKNEYRKQTNRQKAYNGHQLINNEQITETQIEIDKTNFEKDLQQALNQLPTAHRACFILRYREALSVNEISKILACPAGTIKSRLFYATKKVSEQMTNWNSDTTNRIELKDLNLSGLEGRSENGLNE